jgi:predicted RND superfamily exporter protein
MEPQRQRVIGLAIIVILILLFVFVRRLWGGI